VARLRERLGQRAGLLACGKTAGVWCRLVGGVGGVGVLDLLLEEMM